MNRILSHALLGSALIVAAASCSKADKADKDTAADNSKVPAAKKIQEATTETKAEPAELSEEEKKAASLEKIKIALAKLETESKKESARWTDELKAAAKTLVTTDYKTGTEALTATLASLHRKPGNAKRDVYRHPAETLEFFGIKPTSKVVEMGAGRGWYTEILAPVVAKSGQLTIGAPDAAGPADTMSTVYGLRAKAFLGTSEDLYGKVKVFHSRGETLSLGEPGSADLVFAAREMHGWQRRDVFATNLKAIVEVLAPGGVFGVVQHRAKPDAKPEESALLGYLPEAWVIAQVEAAGLKLEEKSEINANAKDTKDYEDGVWTLPPSLGLGEQDKAKYEAIGESDRMTLRFVKPAPASK